MHVLEPCWYGEFADYWPQSDMPIIHRFGLCEKKTNPSPTWVERSVLLGRQTKQTNLARLSHCTLSGMLDNYGSQTSVFAFGSLGTKGCTGCFCAGLVTLRRICAVMRVLAASAIP